MTIRDYVEIMIPMVRLLLREEKENPQTFKKTQLWYIYRQYFYGFAEFVERDRLFLVSENAQKEYGKRRLELNLDIPKDLVHMNWEHQLQFDKGRKVFNLDHVYTGGMFRDAVKKLDEKENLNVESITELVQENYRMAWILKEEEKQLPRSNRGVNLQNALEFYAKNGITIMPKIN